MSRADPSAPPSIWARIRSIYSSRPSRATSCRRSSTEIGSSSDSARPSMSTAASAMPVVRRWPTPCAATPVLPDASVRPPSRCSGPSRSPRRGRRAHRRRGRSRERRAAARPDPRGGGVPDARSVSPRDGPVERETLVVDIGGGSSEFCGGHARRRVLGLPVCGSASNRLTTTFASSDPPTVPDGARDARSAIATMRGSLDAAPHQVVAVGGTASNLLKVAPEAAEPTVSSRASDWRLPSRTSCGRGGRGDVRALSRQPEAGAHPARWRRDRRRPHATLRGRPRRDLRGESARRSYPRRRACRLGWRDRLPELRARVAQ